MGNQLWEDSFPSAEVIFLPEGDFDHFPMVIHFFTNSTGKKPFKIFNFWTQKEDVLDVVRDAWNEQIDGHLSYQIHRKLVTLKKILKL